MTTFYLVRHGKTTFNKVGRLQGGVKDSPLLPESIENAKKTGCYLGGVDFDAAFSSPQKRAFETGENIIAQFDTPLELQKVDALREFDFGDWDGDLAADHIDDPRWQAFLNDPQNFDGSSFNAESYYDLVDRVEKTLKDIATKYPDANILLTAHALVITFAVKHLLGKELNEIREEGLVANTSVTVLELEPDLNGEATLKRWNDTTHLV